MKTFIQTAILVSFSGCLLSGCVKTFLDKKPSTLIVVPQTLNDFQALLDNANDLNINSPGLPTLSADEYYFPTYSSWEATLTPIERYAYIWSSDIYNGSNPVQDWDYPYETVFYSNVVLSGLEGISPPPQNLAQWQNIKGCGLFLRSFAFFDLLQSFSPVFDSATANSDLGIPLRLDPNVDHLTARSSVQQSYDQVLSDLKSSTDLLGPIPFNNLNRGSKPAAYALLSRIYLNMRHYVQAEAYADSSLALYDSLIDYNTISQSSNTPFQTNNGESIYFNVEVDYQSTEMGSRARLPVDSNLYHSYAANDLRRLVFFRLKNGLPYIKRGYQGTWNAVPFSGLAVDELYLIKAECLVRRGQMQPGMDELNKLLVKRWATGTFIPYTAVDQSDALNQILLERRKELIWRGLRWSDLRRLNKEGFNITLNRSLNGQNYQLPPNDPKYTFPIPQYEINLSGIQQNPR